MVVVAFEGDCLCDRHSGFPFWDFCFVSCKPSDERTNGRKNKRSNKRTSCFGVATGSPCGSACRPLCCPTRKGATDNKVWFSANQKFIPLIVRDAISFFCRARRSHNHRFASADAFKLSRTTSNKEAMPPGAYLVASGSDDPDFHGVTFRLDGDRWLVTAFACNYSNFSGRTKIRRKYFMVII